MCLSLYVYGLIVWVLYECLGLCVYRYMRVYVCMCSEVELLIFIRQVQESNVCTSPLWVYVGRQRDGGLRSVVFTCGFKSRSVALVFQEMRLMCVQVLCFVILYLVMDGKVYIRVYKCYRVSWQFYVFWWGSYVYVCVVSLSLCIDRSWESYLGFG